MTLGQVLKKYPKAETELLLSFVLRKPKEFLFLHPEHKITNKQFNKLAKLISCREKGEPVAYLLGYKDFCGFRFKVDKRVLIPRPETEEMAEAVRRELEKQGSVKRFIKVLDVGTGSGCIVVSLAKLLKGKGHFQFFASDVSARALKVARLNAKKHKAKVAFFKSDLMGGLQGNFDVIVANLPYGWQEWKNASSAETAGLKFEPQKALFTEESGLKQVRRLLEQAAGRARKPVLIFLEFDPRQKSRLARLAKKILPTGRQFFFRDLGGRWRYLKIEI